MMKWKTRLSRLVYLLGTVWVATNVLLQPVQAMAPDEARHLLHRTGFGVSIAQWQSVIDLEYDAAVDKLVDEARLGVVAPPPEWVSETPLWTIRQRGWTPEQRRELRLEKRAKIAQLRVWWINQMLSSSSPLQERMTLFWSNHFTTQYSKIYAPMLTYRQHMLLRTHALGRFDQLLQKVLRDPAMLLYLDNDKNNARSVNENLARELMELFTLGEGHYTERDVKEAARALSGWGVVRDSGAFRISAKHHDKRRKTILGRSGNFDGDDLAGLLLAQPATSERVVRKLWLEFISLEPDEALVGEWAGELRENKFAIDELLKTMFKSRSFRAAGNRGVLIKSPIELYVGLMRPALNGLTHEQVADRVHNLRAGKRLPALLKQAGQNLFDPPSVAGWPGGLEWIDSRTLLSREHTVRNLVMQLSAARSTGNPYLENLNGRTAGRQPLMNNLNAIDPVTHIPNTYTQSRLLLELIRDPSVHVK